MPFVLLVIKSVFVFIFSGIFVQRADAYLDPGTGSYMFQMIIAIAIGGLFAIKLWWAKIVLFFSNLFSIRKKNG